MFSFLFWIFHKYELLQKQNKTKQKAYLYTDPPFLLVRYWKHVILLHFSNGCRCNWDFSGSSICHFVPVSFSSSFSVCFISYPYSLFHPGFILCPMSSVLCPDCVFSLCCLRNVVVKALLATVFISLLFSPWTAMHSPALSGWFSCHICHVFL